MRGKALLPEARGNVLLPEGAGEGKTMSYSQRGEKTSFSQREREKGRRRGNEDYWGQDVEQQLTLW